MKQWAHQTVFLRNAGLFDRKDTNVRFPHLGASQVQVSFLVAPYMRVTYTISMAGRFDRGEFIGLVQDEVKITAQKLDPEKAWIRRMNRMLREPE